MLYGISSKFLLSSYNRSSILQYLNFSLKVLLSTNKSIRNNSNVDEDGLPIDYKEISVVLMSKRLNSLISKATGCSSASTEKMITNGDVRINEIVVKKKAQEIKEDDDIEIWIRAFEENSRLAITKRLKITQLFIDLKGYNFKIKYWREFLVENWK